MTKQELPDRALSTERDVTDRGFRVNDLIARYESKVFALAMHLIGDEKAAKKVAEDVFVRFSRESDLQTDDELDAAIHRFTYDAAIPVLVAKRKREKRILESKKSEDIGPDVIVDEQVIEEPKGGSLN